MRSREKKLATISHAIQNRRKNPSSQRTTKPAEAPLLQQVQWLHQLDKAQQHQQKKTEENNLPSTQQVLVLVQTHSLCLLVPSYKDGLTHSLILKHSHKGFKETIEPHWLSRIDVGVAIDLATKIIMCVAFCIPKDWI